MKTIRYQRTLLYYDGPQVFLAKDLSGHPHIGVLVDRNQSADIFVVVQVPRHFLDLFLNGLVDLRRVLFARSTPTWYIAHISDDFSAPIKLEPQTANLEDSAFLPKSGLYIQEAERQFQSPTASQDIFSIAYGSPNLSGQWNDQDTFFQFADKSRTEIDPEEMGLELAA